MSSDAPGPLDYFTPRPHPRRGLTMRQVGCLVLAIVVIGVIALACWLVIFISTNPFRDIHD